MSRGDGAEAPGTGGTDRADETDRADRPSRWSGAFGRVFGPGRARRRARAPRAEPLTAFVLAGGGSRGAVQVGMLAELTARGIRADRVYGASVGAVNGAAYAGDPTPAGVAKLDEVWRGLSGNDVFPRGRMDGPWLFFQQRQSVHPNSGLRRIVTEGIDYERLEDAAVPLEVVATSLTDGAERWLTEGPAVDAVLASAAIPAIFPPVVIDGDTLIDGGVVNNVPLARALAAGATRVYVLLCGPLHFRPREPRRPAEAVLTAFFVAVHARFVRELAQVPPGVEVVVFSGGGDPDAAYRDFSATAELIAQGRAEVAAVLDGHRRATEDVAEAAGLPAEPPRGALLPLPADPGPPPTGDAAGTAPPPLDDRAAGGVQDVGAGADRRDRSRTATQAAKP